MEYAAKDSSVLFELAKAVNVEKESVGSEKRLIDASNRYANVWRSITSSNRGYYEHEFLLVGILDKSNGLEFTCNCCSRSIDRKYFSKTAHRLKEKRSCPVCKALSTQASTQAQWDELIRINTIILLDACLFSKIQP